MKKIFLILLILITPYLSYANVNEDLYIDRNGWCVDFNIPFEIYSQSNWTNREEILDDEDINFTDLDINVIIYNGPFDSEDRIIFEREFDTDAEIVTFDYTFTEIGQYLLEVENNDNSSFNYEEIIQIEDCRINYITPTFNYSLDIEDKINVKLLNTEINTKENFKINSEEFNSINNEALSKEITPETISFYSIKTKDEETGSLILNFTLDQKKKNYKLYFLDEESSSLNEISNIKISNTSLIYETNNFGIYGLYQEKIIFEEIVENITEEIEVQNQRSNIQKEEVIEKSSGGLTDYSKWIIIGCVIVIILIFAPKLFNTKTQKQTYQEQRDSEAKQKITTSKEAYEKTKEYVTKYKNQYSRDAIEKALKTSGVSDEIIQLVFDEKYYEK